MRLLSSYLPRYVVSAHICCLHHKHSVLGINHKKELVNKNNKNRK